MKATKYLAKLAVLTGRNLGQVDLPVERCSDFALIHHDDARNQLGEMISLTDRHRKFLARGAAEGLHDGITVPACPVGGRTGSCPLCGPRRSGDTVRRIGAVQIIGPFAFHAAYRFATTGRFAEYASHGFIFVSASVSCLQGKSNGVIAQILGLKSLDRQMLSRGCTTSRSEGNEAQLLSQGNPVMAPDLAFYKSPLVGQQGFRPGSRIHCLRRDPNSRTFLLFFTKFPYS